MLQCQICGNDIDFRSTCCPFCGSEQNVDKQQEKKGKIEFRQKNINLEAGLPTVGQALSRLQRELTTARFEQVRLLTLIHGYGSTGKGGVIRVECRRTLEYLLAKGEISELIFGENFTRRHGAVKNLLMRFPALTRHPHLNNANKGISLVLL